MAKPTRTELLNRIARLEAQLAQDEQTLTQVRELLSQADERRRAEPANERKWNRVLENLEHGLDETKARVNGGKVLLMATRKELDSFPVAVGDGNMAIPDAEEEEVRSDGLLAGDYRALAEAISETPLSQLGRFNLEEVAEVSRHLGYALTPDNFPGFERLAAHLEFANQHRTLQLGQGEDAPQERRRQVVLRASIDKVLKQQFNTMSREEMSLVLASHELLLRNLRSGPRDDRIKRLLATGVAVIKRRLKLQQQ